DTRPNRSITSHIARLGSHRGSTQDTRPFAGGRGGKERPRGARRATGPGGRSAPAPWRRTAQQLIGWGSAPAPGPRKAEQLLGLLRRALTLRTVLARTHRSRVSGTTMTTVTAPRVYVGSADDVLARGCVQVSGGGHGIAVFAHEGRFYAIDNRCPHMGF